MLTKTINFDRNDNISDISYLGNLASLNHVSFQTNNITDMSVVSGLTDLTYLALSGNNISDPSAVDSLTNLTSLGLGYNQISDISVVADMYGLTFLYCICLVLSRSLQVFPAEKIFFYHCPEKKVKVYFQGLSVVVRDLKG